MRLQERVVLVASIDVIKLFNTLNHNLHFMKSPDKCDF